MGVEWGLSTWDCRWSGFHLFVSAWGNPCSLLGNTPRFLFISDRKRIPINGLRVIRRVPLAPPRRKGAKDISVLIIGIIIFRQNFWMIGNIPCKELKMWNLFVFLFISHYTCSYFEKARPRQPIYLQILCFSQVSCFSWNYIHEIHRRSIKIYVSS